MTVEVEKIVYRDREPADEEAPIQFARENKKVQRSAAPKVQRSAAPPPVAPQESGMIEDTFPIIEFEGKPERFIEDTFPIIEFDSADAVEAAPRRSPVIKGRALVHCVKYFSKTKFPQKQNRCAGRGHNVLQLLVRQLRQLPKTWCVRACARAHTHTHTSKHAHCIYTHMRACICVCVRERERARSCV